MIDPPIASLMEKVDSKYTLVVETAKRARQLAEGADSFVSCKSEKPVTIAINEISKGKISYERKKTGIK